MKIIKISLLIFLLGGCSFDTKSRIWKNQNQDLKSSNENFKEFETLSNVNETFYEIIELRNSYKFRSFQTVENNLWFDKFYNGSNQLENFQYKDLNTLNFKSKKIQRGQFSDYILYDKGNIILNDKKGNIIVYSKENRKIIAKFNFYKKKFKNFNFNLNLVLDNDIIYVSDNIGYLYALDYKKNKLLWAKNYKVPFRSNLKISGSKLIAADQMNHLYFFDKNNGNTLKLIPSEETIVKNEFINNLALNNNNLFYLNTYGSLYSININNLNLNWFQNFNQSLDINPSNLFEGNGLVSIDNKLILSTDKNIYILDTSTGAILFRKNLSSSINPIILGKNIFLVTNNNLLISIDLETFELIYSFDINQKVADFLKSKKYKLQFQNIMIVNNKIFIYLKNSYILKFDLYGNLEKIDKLPAKLNSNPIVVDNSILFLNKQNKLTIVN